MWTLHYIAASSTVLHCSRLWRSKMIYLVILPCAASPADYHTRHFSLPSTYSCKSFINIKKALVLALNLVEPQFKLQARLTTSLNTNFLPYSNNQSLTAYHQHRVSSTFLTTSDEEPYQMPYTSKLYRHKKRSSTQRNTWSRNSRGDFSDTSSHFYLFCRHQLIINCMLQYTTPIIRNLQIHYENHNTHETMHWRFHFNTWKPVAIKKTLLTWPRNAARVELSLSSVCVCVGVPLFKVQFLSALSENMTINHILPKTKCLWLHF